MGSKEAIALAALKALLPVAKQIVDAENTPVATDPTKPTETTTNPTLDKVSHFLQVFDTILNEF